MRMFTFLALLLPTLLMAAADIDEMQAKDLHSTTLKDLYKVTQGLQKDANKELSLREREVKVFKVVPEDDQKEWQAIRELADKVNPFGSKDDQDAKESVTAFRNKKPSWD